MISNSESYVLLLSGNKAKQSTASKWILKALRINAVGLFFGLNLGEKHRGCAFGC